MAGRRPTTFLKTMGPEPVMKPYATQALHENTQAADVVLDSPAVEFILKQCRIWRIAGSIATIANK
jgi:cellobiose-specific phosphotransferase system component IIB